MIAFVFLALACVGSIEAEPRRVLLIHSFGYDFAPFDSFTAGFRTSLAADFPDSIDFFQVSVESARFGDGEADDALVDYLLTLFDQRAVDLVVSIGGPAALFVQEQRETLFPGVPLLMAAVDKRHLNSAAYAGRNVVVSVENEPAKIMDTILKVLPETATIAVVIGNSPLERFWLDELRREFRVYEDRVELLWLNELTFEEIQETCATLPPRSAIFYPVFYIDSRGIPYSGNRVLSRLRETANAPIFGLHDTQLGHGIVGGPLTDVAGLAVHTAEVAQRLLHGETPDNIGDSLVSTGGPRFDGTELNRWNISEESLPPESVVENLQPDFLERYRGRIVFVSAIVLVQFALIGGLLFNLSRRRRAERLLQESESRLSLATETAGIGVWMWDTADNHIWATEGWRAMFGFEAAADIDGDDVRQRIHPDDRKEIEEKIENATQEGSPLVAEFRLVQPDGSQSWVAMRGRMIPAENGGGARLLGASVDVTKRREAEQAARDFGRRLISAQEQERARLGRELHDDISQRLARLAIDAGTVERLGTDERVGEAMGNIRKGLVRLSDDIHSLAYQIHPAILDDLGLVQALKSECERFSRQESVPAHAHFHEVPSRLPRDASLCLFRVAQEALRNVARHARARSVDLSLWAKDDGLRLAISDTGVGFDPAQARERPSLGLKSMRERVGILNGELDIETIPGHGTTIIAWIPFDQNPA